MGKKLMHQLATKTAHLKPPHNYVPWLTINGEHTEKLQEQAWKDLIGLVCQFYHGPEKPKQCLKLIEEFEFVLLP